MHSPWIIFLFSVTLVIPSNQIKILQGNDDGWAEANIRALYQTLKQAGFQSIISAPAINKSGTGSTSSNWENLRQPGQYGTIPQGAPGIGHNSSDDHIWYVNAYPVDGIRYGIDTLSPRFYAQQPDIVVSGPNVGENVSLQKYFSGTLGAALYASERGLPSIAISTDDHHRHSFEKLTSSDSSYIYAKVTIRILNELIRIKDSGQFLPPKCTLNINLQKSGQGTNCLEASDYKFALTTTFGFSKSLKFNHCGSKHLPAERKILKRHDGCWGTVTVIRTRFKDDGTSDEQHSVLMRSPNFFSCPNSKTINF
ncbi:hypothetical protein O181_087802 [Austropuccinia psidii MF-1]|uniref:Survival protein SurE-like phosphatase/nucleotidase domain-containing protein n=1 Tax=Austropuccinia psidii MF-1 TaxID=1389203 RepID=A0A9Q3IQE2_9BASI|nr:hypothetical protein [Austropuccinia psidii MF-1]